MSVSLIGGLKPALGVGLFFSLAQGEELPPDFLDRFLRAIKDRKIYDFYGNVTDFSSNLAHFTKLKAYKDKKTPSDKNIYFTLSGKYSETSFTWDFKYDAFRHGVYGAITQDENNKIGELVLQKKAIRKNLR